MPSIGHAAPLVVLEAVLPSGCSLSPQLAVPVSIHISHGPRASIGGSVAVLDCRDYINPLNLCLHKTDLLGSNGQGIPGPDNQQNEPPNDDLMSRCEILEIHWYNRLHSTLV